ncbi:MAG: DinB family protein [Cytophagales bacterium]|nr:DinB family protein [Cytophagales bacterium]
MQLKTTGQTILKQLLDLTNQLVDAEYSEELDLLNGNSIGKHVRHVIEFFELLITGAKQGLINYDGRKHGPRYEKDTCATQEKLRYLVGMIDEIEPVGHLVLEVSYAETEEASVRINSSVERELAYNIEHAIHHMAIIKIAVNTVFPRVQLPQNFGVAYSTVRYQKSARD